MPQVASSDASHGTSQGPAAPPLPPRPGDSGDSMVVRSPYATGLTSTYGMSPYSSPYGMFGGGYGSPYGGYGGIGAYGGYRGNYGDATGGSDFIRLAEESSRQAFQSIESIVQAFASVSMMLESTYFAVHSSFRAVLGVAEHFSRLRGHMASLTIIRTVSLYLKKLAYIAGLSSIDPVDEEAWRRALNAPSEGSIGLNGDSTSPVSLAESIAQGNVNNRKSSWPIALFFAVVFGTPWLIWKLLMGLTNSPDGISSGGDSKWTRELGPHYIAKGLYDFVGSSSKEVSFRANQRLIVAPKELQPAIRGWLLASDGKVTGLVPANYIEITAHKKGDIEAVTIQGNSSESNDMQSRPGQLEEAFALASASTSTAGVALATAPSAQTTAAAASTAASTAPLSTSSLPPGASPSPFATVASSSSSSDALENTQDIGKTGSEKSEPGSS